MALVDEVVSRYSAARLKQITNPDAPATVSYDAARLALAATDAEARFVTLVGLELDLTDAQHVDVAVEGVVAILKARGGMQDGASAISAFTDACNKYAHATSRARLVPTTDSPVVPSEEESGPGFADPSIWTHFAPDSPAGSADEDLPLDG